MKKRVCILMGSPRKNGNTMQLLQPFMQQLQQSGESYRQRGRSYGAPTDISKVCTGLCVANLLCSLCGGRGYYFCC